MDAAVTSPGSGRAGVNPAGMDAAGTFPVSGRLLLTRVEAGRPPLLVLLPACTGSDGAGDAEGGGPARATRTSRSTSSSSTVATGSDATSSSGSGSAARGGRNAPRQTRGRRDAAPDGAVPTPDPASSQEACRVPSATAAAGPRHRASSLLARLSAIMSESAQSMRGAAADTQAHKIEWWKVRGWGGLHTWCFECHLCQVLPTVCGGEEELGGELAGSNNLYLFNADFRQLLCHGTSFLAQFVGPGVMSIVGACSFGTMHDAGCRCKVGGGWRDRFPERFNPFLDLLQKHSPPAKSGTWKQGLLPYPSSDTLCCHTRSQTHFVAIPVLRHTPRHSN